MSDARGTSPPLGLGTLASLSAPSLPLVAVGFVLNSYLPEYYSTKFGYQLGTIGVLLTAVRLLDIACDPVLGSMMDRTRTRFGRFKLWHAAGIPLMIAGSMMLFLPQSRMPIPWVAGGLVLIYIGQSIGLLSQFALAALLASGFTDRLKVYSWIQFGNMAGVISMLVLPPVIVSRLGLQQNSIAYGMGLMLLILTPAAMGVLLFKVREPPGMVERVQVRITDYFRLFRYRSVRTLVLADLFIGLALGMCSSLLVLFFTRVHGWSYVQTTYLLLLEFSIGLACSPAWPRIAARLDKRAALTLVGAGIVVAQLSMFLIPVGGAPLAYAIFIFYGFVYSGAQILPKAMMADIVDEVLLDTGADLKGVLFAYVAGTYKTGLAVSVGLALGTLSLIGFNPASKVNAPAAVSGLLLLTVLGPAVLGLACTVFAWRYPLTRPQHNRIVEALRTREPSFGVAPA